MGRRHASHDRKRRAITRQLDVTPDQMGLLTAQRDTYKWLLLLALRQIKDQTFHIPSYEMQTRLAGQLFDAVVAPTPEGGGDISLIHVQGLPIQNVPSMEEVQDGVAQE